MDFWGFELPLATVTGRVLNPKFELRWLRQPLVVHRSQNHSSRPATADYFIAAVTIPETAIASSSIRVVGEFSTDMFAPWLKPFSEEKKIQSVTHLKIGLNVKTLMINFLMLCFLDLICSVWYYILKFSGTGMFTIRENAISH